MIEKESKNIKGGYREGSGRPKGVPNKATKQFRETIQQLLDNNSENVEKWLTEVATGTEDTKPDPKGALDMLAKLAEFAAPKLARTEVVGDVEAPVQLKVSWEDD
jgi:hypothetical protein